jgi:hypothetical protein
MRNPGASANAGNSAVEICPLVRIQPGSGDPVMASYREHITVSGLLGIGCGAAAFLSAGYSFVQSAIAAALTWVAGMLPDLDAEGGRPIRELMTLLAALTPLLLMQQVHSLGMSSDHTLFFALLTYGTVRYGGAFLLARLTVHRGMFHSIPALLIFSELTFLTYHSEDLRVRTLMAVSVGLGFLSHLVLDEMYSVQWDGSRVRFAKSAGSALKFWGDAALPNGVALGLLIFLTYAVLVELNYIRDPSKVPAPEVLEVTSELPDAPLYR